MTKDKVCPYCDHSSKNYDVSYDYETLLDHVQKEHKEKQV